MRQIFIDLHSLIRPLVGDFYLCDMEKEILKQEIDSIVSQEGFFLIEFILRGDKKQRIIEVYIDGKEAVTSSVCAELSRIIKDKIESEQLIDSNYRLDVSSPGIERPLKFLEQYHKHINRNFEVHYQAGDEKRKIEGKLIRIDGDKLIFEVKPKSAKVPDEYEINFKDINKAKVLISF